MNNRENLLTAISICVASIVAPCWALGGDSRSGASEPGNGGGRIKGVRCICFC